MKWHFDDKSWHLSTVPICTLNKDTAPKSCEQVLCIVEDVFKNSSVIGSNNKSIHTTATENEASAGQAADLLKNFGGAVRCVVHTMALVVKDVLLPDTS